MYSIKTYRLPSPTATNLWIPSLRLWVRNLHPSPAKEHMATAWSLFGPKPTTQFSGSKFRRLVLKKNWSDYCKKSMNSFSCVPTRRKIFWELKQPGRGYTAPTPGFVTLATIAYLIPKKKNCNFGSKKDWMTNGMHFGQMQPLTTFWIQFRI